MKTLALLSISFLIAMPQLALGAKKDSAPDDDAKRNTTIVELDATVDQAHEAALLALAKIGCKIKKDKTEYIEAKRPNKMGLAVGSGGEKLFVWIEDLSEGRVKVTVKTKKTTVGIVGQKLWNEEVAADIASGF